MSEIRLGRYRHFKGKEYEVLFLANHSETMEQMVVYRALYGERGVWVRPASMWNEMVMHNGKMEKRFTYLPPSHYLLQMQEYFESRNINFDDTLVRQIAERKAGRSWSLSEHVQALIYAQLTNQTKWSRIAPHLKEIDGLFFQYEPEKLKSVPGSFFAQGLFHLKCGNISTSRQMDALANNIRVFEQIEKEFGSVDSFLLTRSADEAVRALSESGSQYKMAMLGEALAWEYVRNVGIDGAKPDAHIRRFLGSERMGASEKEEATVEEALQQIDRLSEETGLFKATIDALIWNFCADGYGEICTKTPHCERCPIRELCKYEK